MHPAAPFRGHRGSFLAAMTDLRLEAVQPGPRGLRSRGGFGQASWSPEKRRIPQTPVFD
jgi:hypothetical protein